MRAEFVRAGIHIDVASAGTGPWHVGKPADARTRASAAARGYDLSEHRARRVQEGDFARHDLLLAMDRENLAELTARCPAEYAARLALFLPFAGISTPQEVPDPYYGGPEDFVRVIDLALAGAEAIRLRFAMA